MVILKIFSLFIYFSVFKIVSFKGKTVFKKMSKTKMSFNKHAGLLLEKVINFKVDYQNLLKKTVEGDLKFVWT